MEIGCQYEFIHKIWADILVKTLSLYYKIVTLYEKLHGALDSFVKKV